MPFAECKERCDASASPAVAFVAHAGCQSMNLAKTFEVIACVLAEQGECTKIRTTGLLRQQSNRRELVAVGCSFFNDTHACMP